MGFATTTSPLRILLMHGTWARNATWPTEAGEIPKRLKEKFGDNIELQAVSWSGKNRNKDRQAAADSVANLVRQTPDQQHVIIAHSHAGNIVSYACKDEQVRRNIKGVVTLATPFIVARRRYGAISVNVTLLMMLSVYVVYLIDAMFLSDMSIVHKAFIFAPLFITFSVIGNFSSTRWIDMAEKFLPELSHALPTNSLVIRAIADETSRGIAITQLPSMATSLLIRKLTRITDKVGKFVENMLGSRRILKAVVAVLVMVMLFSPVLLFIQRDYWPLTILIGICALVSFQFAFIIVLITKRMPVMQEVFAIPASALVAPLIFLVAIFSAIFGPKFTLANFYLDVSVEATPPGRYTVSLVEDSHTTDGSALQHSSIYENADAIAAIEDYIENLLALKRTSK